ARPPASIPVDRGAGDGPPIRPGRGPGRVRRARLHRQDDGFEVLWVHAVESEEGIERVPSSPGHGPPDSDWVEIHCLQTGGHPCKEPEKNLQRTCKESATNLQRMLQ